MARIQGFHFPTNLQAGPGVTIDATDPQNPVVVVPGPDALTTGEASSDRRLQNQSFTMTSGVLRLSYFTAQKTETITQLRMSSATTAAGATPTLVKMFVYTVDGAGDMTLVGVTANDTSLFATINTAYTRSLVGSFSKTRGSRYATGTLVVTGAAAPTIAGNQPTFAASEAAMAPRIAGALTAQTDVPASITAASLTNATAGPYVVLLP